MQPTLQSSPRAATPIKSLRLILMALIAGLLLFAIVAFVAKRFDERVWDTAEIAHVLVYVAAGMLATGIAVALMIRANATRKLAGSKAEALALIRADRVPPSLSAAIIAGAALVEGPGLLGAVTHIIGGPAYALALPIVAAVMIAWMIPSRQRLEESLI